ncbi:MAG TPA: class II aldolase/adducin family protein [Flavobacteriales bacterium]|nr:class II aldolase/adducin family protein [Flavobacteriales bacterium]
MRKYLIYPETVDNLLILDGRLALTDGDDPSGELEMHWLLLKEASTTRCVLHVHSTNIVAAMFAGWSLPAAAAAFPEVYRYTRVGPNVPSLPAISQELAEATAEAFGIDNGVVQFDVVGQANHGVCAVGRSPWDAFEHIERLEHICQIVLNSGVSSN